MGGGGNKWAFNEFSSIILFLFPFNFTKVESAAQQAELIQK